MSDDGDTTTELFDGTHNDAIQIDVFGDFVCPWSYAALDNVEQLVTKYGLRHHRWHPHHLRPDMPAEGMPYADTSKREAKLAWFKEIAPEAAARMRFPDRMQNSFLAFQAFEYADDLGFGWEYKSAVFDALWVDGKDISNCDTLLEAAVKVNIDPEPMGTVLRSGTYKSNAEQAVQGARTLGVTCTPTIFLGRMRVNGWHYFEVLDRIVADQLQPSPLSHN